MESGRLEEEKLLVWNRLPGYNFVLVFFSIFIIVIFCHLSLLCLKMAPGGLKLVAANKHLAVKEEFDFRFWKAFYHSNLEKRGWTSYFDGRNWYDEQKDIRGGVCFWWTEGVWLETCNNVSFSLHDLLLHKNFYLTCLWYQNG